MRQSKTRPMAWLLAGLLAGGSALAADPQPVDPAARAVIDELVTGKDKTKKPTKPAAPKPIGAAKKKPAVAVPAPAAKVDAPAADVINELAKDKDPDRITRDRRDGLAQFQKAQAAKKTGRLVEAMRLAKDARRLFPDNAQINDFYNELQKEMSGNRLVGASNSRAKAHLAAGLTRGQELMSASRFREAEDLLKGVIEGSLLFPEGSNVELFRRLADRELDKYKADVRAGRVIAPPPAASTDKKAPEPKLVGVGAAAQDNTPRLLRAGESQIPNWYSSQKNRLAALMTVNYRRTPLALILDDIRDKSGVVFVIDEPVERSRAHVNTTVDLRVGEVPAESILNLACLKAGLEYIIMERAVVITTPAKAIEYVRQMPESLRRNWLMARTLFPEKNSDLFATAPALGIQPVVAAQRDLDSNVPAHLASGKALVEDIKKLLR